MNSGPSRSEQSEHREALRSRPRRRPPDFARRLKLREATSGRLSSNPGERSDGPPASLREALRAGVLEDWSIAHGQKPAASIKHQLLTIDY